MFLKQFFYCLGTHLEKGKQALEFHRDVSFMKKSPFNEIGQIRVGIGCRCIRTNYFVLLLKVQLNHEKIGILFRCIVETNTKNQLKSNAYVVTIVICPAPFILLCFGKMGIFTRSPIYFGMQLITKLQNSGLYYPSCHAIPLC